MLTYYVIWNAKKTEGYICADPVFLDYAKYEDEMTVIFTPDKIIETLTLEDKVSN